jgi:hypothetical protein
MHTDPEPDPQPSVKFSPDSELKVCLVFRYVAVLERDGDSVGMEDLDSLQLELESLLSSVVVRAALGSWSELLINSWFFIRVID